MSVYLFRKVTVIVPQIMLCLVIVRISVAQSVRFTDVALSSGIDFKYTFGDDTYENILESSGSGVTVLDYDGDGWMDLFFLNGVYLEGISDSDGIKNQRATNQLYRNNGDGTFTNVTEQAGLINSSWSMAAGAVDYDKDGDVDIYLLNYGPNVFYQNNGDGTFSDITDKLGVRGPEKLNGFTKWSVGVAFWDYDQNGRVDMMVGNFLAFDPEYVSLTAPEMMPHPSEYKGQASLFYEQQADGTFVEVTEKPGFYYPQSMCMGLTVYDYNNDGLLDLFQGNDHQKNFLFENQGRNQFKEKGVASGVAVNSKGETTGSMHGTIGDVDGDGLIDLLVTDLKYGALYRNLGNGLHEDITESSGVAKAFAGKGQWGAALFDFDNDGDLDIFTADGTAEELRLQLPLLLSNDGKGVFTDVGQKTGPYFREMRSGRGAAVLDYDNDGDLDIVVSHVDLKSTPVLLKNEGGNRNNWIGINLLSKNGQFGAIGAKVIVTCGDFKQAKVNQWATSYLSSNDPRIHFGLRGNKKIDAVEIYWPDGSIEKITNNLPINKYLTIQQGKGVLN